MVLCGISADGVCCFCGVFVWYSVDVCRYMRWCVGGGGISIDAPHGSFAWSSSGSVGACVCMLLMIVERLLPSESRWLPVCCLGLRWLVSQLLGIVG